MRVHRRYWPWERVWGRDPHELTFVVDLPVEEGILSSVEGEPDPRLLVIRPALGSDHVRLDRVRCSDRAWLAPWEPSCPPQALEEAPTLAQYRRRMDRWMRQGRALVMVVELDGAPCGVVSVNDVVRGAMFGAVIGYWVHSSVVGRGLGSYAVACVIDLLIGELGMHRVEVNVRPENAASLALVRKLGLRQEGYRERYLHINGQWADHVQFAIDSESFPVNGVVSQLFNAVDEF